jgi:hypothetical protein
MTKSTYETIIIGAGIAGLACAYHLKKHQHDFLLISKDIGGRILSSHDGTANYGAFFVCSDYHNVLPFVTIQKRIRLRDFCFHENQTTYVLYEPKLILYFSQFIKIKRHLYRFRNHLRTLRKTTEQVSQKNAIESDPYLHELYMTNAVDFVKKHRLTRGTETYLSKALYSTTFSAVQNMNAFSYLQFLLPLITPIYTFTFKKDKITSPFQENILIDTVEDITYKKNHYKVKTQNESYSTKNLILATELNWSCHFAQITEMNSPVSTHMVHVRGIPKKRIARRTYQLFCHPSNIQAIAALQDGTSLVYYKDAQPRLEDFFQKPEVIASHFWDPAGRINGHVLIESKKNNHLYLIGDYNVAGLEETFITGKYAAHEIIASEKRVDIKRR